MPDRTGVLLLACPDAEALSAALSAMPEEPPLRVCRLDRVPPLPELLDLCRERHFDRLLLVVPVRLPALPPELSGTELLLPEGRRLPLLVCVLPPLPDDAALARQHAAHLRRVALWHLPDDTDGRLPPSPARTLEAARLARLDVLRMAAARLRHWKTLPPAPPSAASRRLLILGGGWTGLTAARTAADCGLAVLLVEREDEPGGAARFLPPPGTNDPEERTTRLTDLLHAVQAHPRIRLLCRTSLCRLEGQPGDFTATLSDGSRHACGSVLLACGWRAPDATPFAGPARHARVMTALTFARQWCAGRIAARRVLFLLAAQELEAQALREVPAADQERLRRAVRQLHASHAVNCLGMLRLARVFAERHAVQGGSATLVFDQMTMPGRLEDAYRRLQAHPGLRLLRAETATAVTADDQAVRLALRLPAPNGERTLAADLLVLPEIMAPADSGGLLPAPDAGGEGILPDVAAFDGYAASNFICFPYETRRTAILAAGCLREPQNLEECAEDAQGAVLAALRDMRAAGYGLSPHPRSGDSACPHFELARCTRCNRCVEECPFGALAIDADGLPHHSPARCRRCGICFGACPERVIALAGQTMEMGRAVLRAPSLTGKRDAPLVLTLACENDALPALRDMQARCGVHPALRIMGVRCLGSVNMQWLADALTGGYDGVLLLGCADGENSQCHFGTGSALCRRRLRNLAAALEERGVDARRVRLQPTARDDAPLLPDRLDGFLEHLAALGPTPFARD